MAAHMPTQGRSRNDPEALERQAMADDEEASLLSNQQAQVYFMYFLNISCCLSIYVEVYI